MAISDLERYCCGDLLNAFQVQDIFCHHGGPRYLWKSGQMDNARRLAKPDRFYTPRGGDFGYRHSSYFIHGYSVISNHSLVQNNLCIGNVAHLTREVTYKLHELWASLPKDTLFLF